jgi:hypothetical protein
MTKHQIEYLKAAAYKADNDTPTDATRAEYFRAVKTEDPLTAAGRLRSPRQDVPSAH